MGRLSNKPLSPVIRRLMAAFRLPGERLDALAKKMELPYSTVRNWHTRDSVPEKYLFLARERSGVSVRWLREGGAGGPDSVHLGREHIELNKTDSADRSEVSKQVEKTVSADRFAPAPLERAVPVQVEEPLPSNGWVLPLTGDGAPLVTTGLIAPQTASLARPLVLPVTIGQAHREFQVIPAMNRAALAGRPPAADRAARVDAATADLAGVMAFDRAWLREHLGRDGGGFVSVSVSGDSMEPALFDGDSIIVDTLVDRVGASGVYVIRLGVDLLVKRVHRKLDGSLVISSDNAQYPPDELPAARVAELRVVGRLVWPRLRG